MKPSDPLEDNWDEFLQTLVDRDLLEGAALGITKKVIAEGEGSLTEEQESVFLTYVINKFAISRCSQCNGDVPWSEMSEALDNDGKCGWCLRKESKIGDE